jgi:hypothetical protein
VEAQARVKGGKLLKKDALASSENLAALRYHWRCSTKPQQLQIILAAKAHTRSGHLYQVPFLLKAQDKCEMFPPLNDSSLYTMPTNAAPSSAGVNSSVASVSVAVY